MAGHPAHKDIARGLFAEVASEFSWLDAIWQEDPVPQVQLEIVFPVQLGLVFPVAARLQGDELCLYVGDAFMCEWFPCTKPAIVAEFRECFTGVLSGELQIVEYYRGDDVVKAQVQESKNGKWIPAATYSKLRWPSFRAKRTRILRNRVG